MDNDLMQHQDRKDDELTRRLEAYAEARLSPELSATIRMRTRIMAAAHRQAALARADADRAAADAAIAAQAHVDRTRRSRWRRPLTALLAAGLTLAVGVGSVAASQAGGPLYGVRIWAETLTLPSEADARAQAELQRLQDRLAEAAAATAAGDTNAANAALEAYAAIVNEATDDAGNDVSAAAKLETGVRSNIDVLTVLSGRVPNDAARDAIQRAIDRSDSALDKMHGNPNVVPPAAEPSRSPKPDKTANPNKPTDVPAPTAKPRPTPKPDATTNAASTPRPDRTPRGGPPSVPPERGGSAAGGPQSSVGN
jgi:hypothetical protein